MVWHLGAPLCHVNELQVLRYDPSAAVMAIGKQDWVCWFPPAEPSMALPKAELGEGRTAHKNCFALFMLLWGDLGLCWDTAAPSLKLCSDECARCSLSQQDRAGGKFLITAHSILALLECSARAGWCS